LKPRAPVVISGVKVGQIAKIELGKDYRARATLDLDPTLALPTDTTASIQTAGLLGDRYVALQLGGEEQTLKAGDEITFTESAVILERLIRQTGAQRPGPAPRPSREQRDEERLFLLTALMLTVPSAARAEDSATTTRGSA
jgi:phospholipid/cholesterol/gamma-HCH transport system substrate-binding protein